MIKREFLVSGKRIPWWEFEEGDSGFRFDIRYSRTDNFTGMKVYSSPSFFLVEGAALDLIRAAKSLRSEGFGLLLFDGYRPWSVSKLFWDRASPHDRQFLADPASGSSHNRASAVDLSLFHLDSGTPVEMPSDFDEMNEKSASNYSGGSELSRFHRDLLRGAMESHRFTGIANEWWHFNHLDRHEWPVMNVSFEEVRQAPRIPLPPQDS